MKLLSSLIHLRSILEELNSACDKKIAVHLITDGRDTSPTAAADWIAEFEEFLQKYPRAGIASLSGRYYAMDRDKRWDRVEKAFAAISGTAPRVEISASEYVKSRYAANETDEFIEPCSFGTQGINAEDSILFFNFRADRMRQIVPALCLENFEGFERKNAPFSEKRTLCCTEYDPQFNLPHWFSQIEIEQHFGEVLARLGKRQLRVAETEKYPHVTYFLNGGKEYVLEGEERTLIPSPRDVKTYDQKPEMSAPAVCGAVVEAIQSHNYDCIVVNFANCDMVGHTGDIKAAIVAVETVDDCLGKIIAALAEAQGNALIIADHGNAEQMIDYQTGKAHTAHTTFPVPAILFGAEEETTLRSGGALCDVAPTLLKLMKLEKPDDMSGESLF